MINNSSDMCEQIKIRLDGFNHPPGPKRKPRWYEGHTLEVIVDGSSFELGSVSGDASNCLIDTLRQKLNGTGSVHIPERSVCEVRRRLEKLHRSQVRPVQEKDFLNLNETWQDLVDLLGDADELKRRDAPRWKGFEILCVDLAWIGNGERYFPPSDHPQRRETLHLARLHQNHFVPLLPIRAPEPAPPPAPSREPGP